MEYTTQKLDTLYALAQENEIPVEAMPTMDTDCLCIRDKEGNCYIALNPQSPKSSADETYMLAHDLGHCMTGAFYNRYSHCDVVGRSEYRADVWAIKHLLPKEELQIALNQGYHQPYELAEHLNLPEPFIRKACTYYALSSN